MSKQGECFFQDGPPGAPREKWRRGREGSKRKAFCHDLSVHCPLPFLRPLLPADFAEKAKIDLAGLSAQEVEAKLKQAVEAAASKPKSEMQSAAVFKLPSIIN